MTKYNQFEHEQALLRTWNITEDLDTVSKAVENDSMTREQVVEVLIALKTIYNLRFSEVWDHFEASLKRAV